MDIGRFAEVRPYLYHLTDRVNLSYIRESKVLFCAADLMKRSGRTDLLRTRRQGHERIRVDGSTLSLRDQKPLLSGNMDLTGGFSDEDFVKALNAVVFFWPGNVEGPIPSGANHFAHYAVERPLMLRCRFQSLLSANPAAEPLFCMYNSGAPRCVNGKKSPRGPNTFLRACDSPRPPSRVVAVTLVGEAALPSETEIGKSPTGQWQPFF